MNLQTHELVNLPTYKLTTSQNEQAPSAKRRARGCRMKKKAATYSPALHCSTIGAGGLNFSVRNGKRWDTAAITT